MNAQVKLRIGDAQLQLPQNVVALALAESLGAPPAGPVPKIGEPWPGQGGVNAGLMRGVDGEPDYYLIVPTDPSAYFEDVTFGQRGEEIEGAGSEYDGMKNTLALLGSGVSHPAAEKCREVCIDGHRDFYLPARRELALCYANVPELFVKAWHWSSTQYSAHFAWVQLFVGGHQDYSIKDNKDRVRAVRRFTLSHSSI